jgi:hypothetical protein
MVALGRVVVSKRDLAIMLQPREKRGSWERCFDILMKCATKIGDITSESRRSEEKRRSIEVLVDPKHLPELL